MNDDILKLMIAKTQKELKSLLRQTLNKQKLLEEINVVLSEVIVPAKQLGTQTLDCDECASININEAEINLQKVITWINEPIIATVKSISIDSLPDFISDGDLCKFLNIEQTTLYTKRSRGELPVQNNYGFTLKDDLVQFLGIKKVKQTPLEKSKQRENNIDKYRKPR